MARKKRTSGSSVNNATTFSTNTFQSGSDTLVLVFVVNFRAALIGTPDIPEVTGNGLVWQQVQSVLGGTQNSRRMTCFGPWVMRPQRAHSP